MIRQDMNTEQPGMQACPLPADRTVGRLCGAAGTVPGGTAGISLGGDREEDRGMPVQDGPEGLPLREAPAACGKTPKRRPYVPPFIGGEIVLRTGNPVLGGSLPVQPGGGGGGSISIEDPIPDPGDDELIGSRMRGFHAGWED